MVETCRHLFIYGTLMSHATGALGHVERTRLVRESRSLGAASITGARLYDLGRYPGLVESGAPTDVVHGEVVLLANPSRTFGWLDAYEEVVPSDPTASAYARLERSVRSQRAGELTAWVYVFLKDITRRRAIASGRW